MSILEKTDYDIAFPWQIVQAIPERPLVHILFADRLRATFDLSTGMKKSLWIEHATNIENFQDVGIINGVLMFPGGYDYDPRMLHDMALSTPFGEVIKLCPPYLLKWGLINTTCVC